MEGENLIGQIAKRREETEDRLKELKEQKGLKGLSIGAGKPEDEKMRMKVFKILENALSYEKRTCRKCATEMHEVLLPTFIFKGSPLHNVYGFKCRRCESIEFSKEQQMRLDEERKRLHVMAFKRKISYVGRSLIITIPNDLVEHLRLKRGQEVNLVPVDDSSFMVEARR